MPPIGELRHRLALEAPEETPDGAGGVERAYVSLGQVWAAIEPLGADARLIADRRVGRLTHRVTVRHRDDLTIHHRFRLGARVLAIRALRDPGEERRFLECLVEEEP